MFVSYFATCPHKVVTRCQKLGDVVATHSASTLASREHLIAN